MTLLSGPQIFSSPRSYVVQVSNMNWHVLLLTLGYFVCVLRPAVTLVQALKIFSDERLHLASECLDLEASNFPTNRRPPLRLQFKGTSVEQTKILFC